MPACLPTATDSANPNKRKRRTRLALLVDDGDLALYTQRTGNVLLHGPWMMYYCTGRGCAAAAKRHAPCLVVLFVYYCTRCNVHVLVFT